MFCNNVFKPKPTSTQLSIPVKDLFFMEITKTIATVCLAIQWLILHFLQDTWASVCNLGLHSETFGLS